MPRMTTLQATVAHLSFGFVDIAGKPGKTGIRDLSSAPGSIVITNLANALGDVSNAAVVSISGEAQTLDTPADRVAFDEGYASVNTKAMFVYENAQRRKKRLEVPAPDASIFNSDGQTIDLANAQVVALDAAYKVIVGVGWTLKRAYLGNRTRKAVSGGNVPPIIAEPGVGQLPPGLPAIEA